jgi:hypothetical protein
MIIKKGLGVWNSESDPGCHPAGIFAVVDTAEASE